MGGLAASYVTISSGLKLKLSTGTLNVQTDILDSIFKGILPLSITLLTVYLLKKKVNVNMVLLILIVIATIGTLIGFF